MGVPEIKPDHEWCPHCAFGRREPCLIYAERPQRCRDFVCQWLQDERFGDYWFPKTSKIIVDTKLEGKQAYVLFVVDPEYPGRWREEPWFSDIKTVAKAGLDGSLDGKHWITVILIKDQRIPVVR